MNTKILNESNQIIFSGLKSKIEKRNSKIGIIGVGYVGLTLAVQLARLGFNVMALDEDTTKLNMISNGLSYVNDVSSNELIKLVEEKKLFVEGDYSKLAEVDIIIICVPTPLTSNKEPDVSYIVNVCSIISTILRPGQVVILESTTYPGTTEDIVLSKLESSGNLVGEDYFLAFSPERVDLGNKTFNRDNIPKIVSGITPKCLEIAVSLYNQIFDVVPVSSTKTAEMIKIFENTYRFVNTSLVNEMALLCDRMNINVWEMLDAAFTKPFGIQAFYPGPGIGGHCIPVDPFYLSWKAKEYDFNVKFIETASEINFQMPNYVINKSIYALGLKQKAIRGSRVLICGISYKKDIADYRESPGLKIIELLQRAGTYVTYFDPLVPQITTLKNEIMYSTELTDIVLQNTDLVIIGTDHTMINYDDLVDKSNIVLDTRNATKLVKKNREKIILL
ncbi:nucleotide sugar dehydrogenase [Bacillus cereus]|uniref:nucleotide sugar dehydrogenase n=1 Tax=Bacillus cereus TaxID=1396 RepID=UPI0035565C49|nr:nucleotide sugar dehydrogenase [Bacillus cereus]